MKSIITISLIFASFLSSGQDKCNCRESLDWITETFKENDAGYIASGEEKKMRFEEKLNYAKAQADSTTSTHTCHLIMNELIWSFRKGHVGVLQYNPFDQMLGATDSSKPHIDYSNAPKIDKLSDQTLLITISSMNIALLDTFKNLMVNHEELINKTPYWIIDIRNSRGGASSCSKPILDYLYTQPYRRHNVKFYSSEFNLKGFENYLIAPLDSSLKAHVKEVIDSMQRHSNQFILTDDVLSLDTNEKVYDYPKYVGIVASEGNGSADEQFLLDARQSKKVKIFGKPTSGAIDASNLNFVDSPDSIFTLMYTMTQTTRVPSMNIDDIGIQPDILLGEEIPSEEWINYVKNWLEGN